MTNSFHREETYQTRGAQGYTVFYQSHMNGGGPHFAPVFPRILRDLFPNRHFSNCMEWCSGPGFIGYEILDHKFCDRLELVDIYRPIQPYIEKTNSHNNITDKVSLTFSSQISNLSPDKKFDLIVSNPPHFKNYSEFAIDVGGDPNSNVDQNNFRVGVDPDWQIHREFFNNIHRHLNPGGVIILLEQSRSGSMTDLVPLFENKFNHQILTAPYDTHKYFYLVLTLKE